MAKKKTHEEYVAELAEKNPNIEVIGKYAGANTKIAHRCLVDGCEWNATPHGALRGSGCPECGIRSRIEKRSKTHEEYVAELAKKNPNVEVIGVYSGALTEIQHHCLVHDVYWDTTPVRALQGVGCNMCHGERIAEKKYKTHEQYVEEIRSVNPNIIAVERYVGARVPILHRCLIHDIEWMTYPGSVLRGCGCPECGNEKVGNKLRKTHEQYVRELKTANPDVVVIGEYINASTPILHKCLIHDIKWNARPNSVLHGCGCRLCTESSGERLIRQWLIDNDIEYECQKYFKDCCDKRPLPFDFYLPKYNCCIEYDGIQHYEPVDYFGGQESLEYTQKHDVMKAEYCKNNGIKLLSIPYYKNTEEELNNFLFI